MSAPVKSGEIMGKEIRWSPVKDGGLPDPAGAVIDGEWIKVTGESLPVEDPGLGIEMGRVGNSPTSLIDQACESSQLAFKTTWGKMDGVARGRIMLKMAEVLMANKTELATMEAVDTGKPLNQALVDIDVSARYFEFYAGIADKINGETIPQKDGVFAYTLREPYGVIGHITPWNSPLNQMSRGIAPSLAAGNTVVVKPSEIAPFSSLVAARLFVKAGLPIGVVNVVPGLGPTTGAALVEHPLVKHVSFTGSVKTGQDVLRRAALKIMPCNLELGGKSPAIVMADGNLKAAAKAAATAITRNAGQSCFATTRFIVHRSVHDELAALIVKELESLRLGHALDNLDIGPLVSQNQMNRVVGFMESAKRDGITIATGGEQIDPSRGGYFFKPTLLLGVKNNMDVAQNEIFGPVQSLIIFDEEEEAIAIANDSVYGLASAVFTNSLSTAHRLASQIEAGQVMINKFPLGSVDTPFGGYKTSGIGREKGVEAIRGYTQLKTVLMDITKL